jgi:hypothetical protein
MTHLKRFFILASVFVLALGIAGSAFAGEDRFKFDLESGFAFNGYNDVRIPGDTGTLFSLTRDLTSKPGLFLRLRLDWRLSRRSILTALFAPLTLKADGTAAEPLTFQDRVFPAGAPLQGSYTFNSYRLTYRYEFIRTDRWTVGAGFTAKIRDAAIRLDSGGVHSEKTNVGFVPLLNFRAEYRGPGLWGFLFEADALAAPQGRAEDILAAVLIRLAPHVTLKAGYRIVEGGADNATVYNFALIHYAVVGLLIDF